MSEAIGCYWQPNSCCHDNGSIETNLHANNHYYTYHYKPVIGKYFIGTSSLPEAICCCLPTYHFVTVLFVLSFNYAPNFIVLAHVVCELHQHMSLYYNVLPEAICFCLLVNQFVYKLVIMTSLVRSWKPIYP